MSYTHFTLEDRETIQKMTNAGFSNHCIGLFLGKNCSSIGREIGRNSTSNEYLAGRAHTTSQIRRKITKPRPKSDNQLLMAKVENLLKQQLSPDEISGRLKLVYPKNPSMHISYNTIYNHLLGLPPDKRESFRIHLRQGRRKHRKRRGKPELRGTIANRVMIDKRPKIVESNSQIGHWEGDTVEGAHKQGYFGTFAERKSKYLISFHIKNKNSDLMTQKINEAFSVIPEKYRRTLTVDNGKEFAGHQEITVRTFKKVFFAHPYHSWERGLNENTNGLLRQYFPKGTSLLNVTKKYLDKVVARLNNRPRKTLGYRTPKEVFFSQGVALQI